MKLSVNLFWSWRSGGLGFSWFVLNGVIRGLRVDVRLLLGPLSVAFYAEPSCGEGDEDDGGEQMVPAYQLDAAIVDVQRLEAERDDLRREIDDD